MEEERRGKGALLLQSITGFGGGVSKGLNLHPRGQHLVYPVGCSVVVEELRSGSQKVLSGHSNLISCLAISPSGAYIASGQITHPGFKAETLVWCFEGLRECARLSMHRNGVQQLAFSSNDSILVTLGGADDGSLVVWDVAKGEALCGSAAQPLSAGLTCVICFFNQDNQAFVTAGNETLRVWKLDERFSKLTFKNVAVGQHRRVFRQLQICSDDSHFTCGTSSGDLMAVNVATNTFQFLSAEKERFQDGVTALHLLPSGRFLVGSGKGKLALVRSLEERFKKTNKVQLLDGAVTSISGNSTDAYVGTSTGSTYHINLSSFHKSLLKTSHHSTVNSLCFPHASSGLLLSSSLGDIRFWSTKQCQEVLRISVANKTCNVVEVSKDGKTILSGWDDGCIRAYYPQSGKLMYVMEHAYGGSVTALTSFNSCSHLVSGSNLGHVVLWQVPVAGSHAQGEPLHVHKHTMMKEHKGEVTCIRMRRDDSECVSSSIDGSCIFWDLSSKSRRQMVRVNTLFKCLRYHPLQHQLLTTGTDRKIAYWEVYDGSLVRQLEGSLDGSVNCLDVSPCGMFFVSGGDDRLIRVWLYEEGEVSHVGIGHSTAITAVCICPEKQSIFSSSEDGAILKWQFPFK